MNNKKQSRETQIPYFVTIARNNYQELQKYKDEIAHKKEEINSFKNEGEYNVLHYELSLLREEASNHVFVVVVFASMAVEAFIYDFAARNLSDSFVRKYLDKLNVVSKWVVIPKLVTGKEFPTDNNSFRLLKELISLRNSYVHSKSKRANFDLLKRETTADDVYEYEKNWDDIFKSADDAYATLAALASEIKKLDPDEPYVCMMLTPSANKTDN